MATFRKYISDASKLLHAKDSKIKALTDENDQLKKKIEQLEEAEVVQLN